EGPVNSALTKATLSCLPHLNPIKATELFGRPAQKFKMPVFTFNFNSDIMKMINSLAFAFLFSIVCFSSSAQTRPGSLRGTVTDSITNEPLPRVNVVIRDDAGGLVDGQTTDDKGKYNINPVAPGHYTVEVSFMGYRTIVVKKVLISPNAPTVLTFAMNEGSINLPPIDIVGDLPLAGKPYSHRSTPAWEPMEP
ncbi:MAG: carboxypeptidase-like regulatory domain-containing protein, partial [Owenweeksia sp.]